MKPDLIECLAIATYLEAAHKITEELDARGFTTDNPENADNLEMVIAEIIQNTIRGNTNFSVADGPKEYEPTDAEMEEMLSELRVEVEHRINWDTPDFPYKEVNVPERKAKFFETGNAHYVILSKDYTRLGFISAKKIQAFIKPDCLKESSNRFMKEAEYFYKVPQTEFEFFDI